MRWMKINTIPKYSWVHPEYEVSDNGEIKGRRGLLQPFNQGCSRGQVWLYGSKMKRKEYPYRIVAMAFVPNPLGKPDINHIDENPLNNRADNLEWVTKKENNVYGSKEKRRKTNLRKRISGSNAEGVKLYTRRALKALYGKISPILRCCNATEAKYKKYKGVLWSYMEPEKQLTLKFK